MIRSEDKTEDKAEKRRGEKGVEKGEEKVRVLLVDDHAMVRTGVRSFLETQPWIEITGEAENASAAFALVAQQAPDVVLLDLLMPDADGAEAARQIKEISPSTRIIALTSAEEEERILSVITAGASAYVLKSVGPRELVGIIRRVAEGEVVLEPRIAALMVRAMQKPPSAPAKSPAANLTEREVEVLRLIAGGLTNGEIAGRLHLSDKTVKTHVSNILSKLQLADRTQAAIFAWREGLIDE